MTKKLEIAEHKKQNEKLELKNLHFYTRLAFNSGFTAVSAERHVKKTANDSLDAIGTSRSLPAYDSTPHLVDLTKTVKRAGYAKANDINGTISNPFLGKKLF